jgi:hypothetical protein
MQQDLYLMTKTRVLKLLISYCSISEALELSMQHYSEKYVHFLVCFENKILYRNMHVI